MIEYTQYKTLSEEYVRGKIQQFLEEDIPKGDITTISTVPSDSCSVAEFQAVEEMVFSGEYVIPFSFSKKCETEMFVSDGEKLSKGQKIATVKGPSSEILSRERTVLNLIQRLCGIATLTRKYTKIAEGHPVKILDTRKTTPGLRMFEKYAVTAGGGFNHRLNLSSGILIKDNHLQSAGSVEKAILLSKQQEFDLPVELEVDTIEQIKEGLKAGVDGFLLDNMSPETTKEAVSIIRNYTNGNKIFIESSGGINLQTLACYLETGINAVSIGALTHSARGMDIRLEFISK
ncbi:MAG: carboxylating nicotinate-nucleotide diphosphorylase [Candidatus Marinimicrobia bacterium]|nr:carboxylating nicotinate-nucleotide diphosphorylase [Candidatus Neomarinimicrobiota bacterium]MBL7023330.1 carboxylating nicotinate-nucleotide diphosphorylase [Candidatus Neomarinimicrobiota bacterium]